METMKLLTNLELKQINAAGLTSDEARYFLQLIRDKHQFSVGLYSSASNHWVINDIPIGTAFLESLVLFPGGSPLDTFDKGVRNLNNIAQTDNLLGWWFSA